jgi:hypothetical protein
MEGGANFVVKVMLEADAVARLTARCKKLAAEALDEAGGNTAHRAMR